MDKADIVSVLEEISVLLELKGENPFKVRAYTAGARALETLKDSLEEMIEKDTLGSIKGMGSALVEKIKVLHETGELKYYDELRASIAPGLIEMLEIPGLGAKKIKKIHDALEIDSIDSLKKACESGQVEALKGFGKKSAEKILTGIKNREKYIKRHHWWSAQKVAEPLLKKLSNLPQVKQAEAAGSLRRKNETVGDLDFIAASEEPEAVMNWFVEQPTVIEVTAHGTTKSSVRFESGLQADLRVVPPGQFAFALHHFTGSKDHNVAMRQRALSQGYSLSEWGLLKKDADVNAHENYGIGDESGLFEFLGLNYIAPELREGRGELEAAEANELPELVKESDIRGVFHNHTTASDGRNTIEEMAAAADALGWEYLGLADHSKASFQANGLNDGQVSQMIERIRAFNESGESKVHVFSGIECDILPDGSLDLEDCTLDALDYTVMSVHSSFGQSEEEMTARVVRAIEHPATKMLGHPTGRLLLRREPYQINLSKVIDAAIANKVIIEINANPHRLDMDWRLWRRAAERGLMCSINPDAHSTDGLKYFSAGINIARKGWLEKEQLLNSKSCFEVAKYFASLKS